MLLIVGIVVAVIVALTTLAYKDTEPISPKTTENEVLPKAGTLSPSSFVKKVIERIDFGSAKLKRM